MDERRQEGQMWAQLLGKYPCFFNAPQKLEATIIKECVFQHPKSTRIGTELEDLNTKTLLNANKYFISL